ncbi:MAG: PIG-L family deacetylase [Actinoplanes sp.]
MDDVGKLGTILGVWAHPDDEAYLSGGLMALASDAGSRVVCVTATRGELGTADPQRWPPARLAAERTGELARCLEILGVTEHHWLGYRDGECAAVPPAEPVARLSELIAEVQPDTVVTFGPDGNTGHPDHRAVGGWAASAFDRAAPAGARLLRSAVTEGWARRWRTVHDRFQVFAPGYPITRSEHELALHLRLDPATVARKARALAAQQTQTGGLIAALGETDYAAWISVEGFVAECPSCWWDVTAARWRCGRWHPSRS